MGRKDNRLAGKGSDSSKTSAIAKHRQGKRLKARKGKAELKNLPLPDDQGGDLAEADLSDEDFAFVSTHSDKLSFLQKIKKDELDEHIIEKQRADIERSQRKTEKGDFKGKNKRKKVDESDSETDLLDEIHFKRQRETSSLRQVKFKKENQLPMKMPDGSIVSDFQVDKKAAEMARRVEGVTVDDAFLEEREPEEERDIKEEDEPEIEVEKSPVQDDLAEIREYHETEVTKEEAKVQIATCADRMLTNPQRSVAPLRRLLLICGSDDVQIRQLALLSVMRVFCDITPGYKINAKTNQSDQQTNKKMDKEYLRTREYETLLLKCYQAYLKLLLNNSHSAHKNGSTNMLQVCVKCLCGLAESLYHFNYGSDLIKSIVGWMKTPDTKLIEMCTKSIAEIIESDQDGGVTLEIIQLVGDLVKRAKCKCDPRVVESLFGVQFVDIPHLSKEGNFQSIEFALIRRFCVEKQPKRVTKHKRKKMFKIRDELEKQGKEFDVHGQQRDKEKDKKATLQSKTVEALFEIFFRVLKHCSHQVHSRSCYESESSVHAYIASKCPLLCVCLRGLATYAHVMSVEYFEDLLKVMNKLLNCESLPFSERFQCLFTITEMFRGQGEALVIDRREFYRHLYGSLINWRPDSTETGPGGNDLGCLMVQACDQMLCETKNSDFGRLAAFVKRMLSVGIHQETGIVMGLCAVTNKLLVKYRRLRTLTEADNEMPLQESGVYDPSIEDASQANGMLTCLWELTLLQKHFNPHVAQAAKHILSIKSDLSDSGSLLSSLLSNSDGPVGMVRQYSTAKNIFYPLPAAKARSSRGDKHGRNLEQNERLRDLHRYCGVSLEASGECPLWKSHQRIADSALHRKGQHIQAQQSSQGPQNPECND